MREIAPTRTRSPTCMYCTPESVRARARRPASYVFACMRSDIVNTVRCFRETYHRLLFLWPYELRSGSRSLGSGPVEVQSRALDITIMIEILRSLSREAQGPRHSFGLGIGQWATAAHACYTFVPTTLDQLVLAFQVRCKTF